MKDTQPSPHSMQPHSKLPAAQAAQGLMDVVHAGWPRDPGQMDKHRAEQKRGKRIGEIQQSCILKYTRYILKAENKVKLEVTRGSSVITFYSLYSPFWKVQKARLVGGSVVGHGMGTKYLLPDTCY